MRRTQPPPWFSNPRIARQNAKRARLMRKGFTPRDKHELRALAAELLADTVGKTTG